MAEPAKKNNAPVELAADAPPAKPGAATKPPISMTEDIISNPERAAYASTLSVIKSIADRNGNGNEFKDYGLAINAMKQQARKGWVGDNFVGELAARGVSRVRFKQENGQIMRDKDGNPIIESDRVQGLAALIVGTAIDEPNKKEISLGEGIKPIAVNKTRVCLAAFADVNMRLKASTETEDKPDAITDATIKEVVRLDRLVKSDAELEARVKSHLANKSLKVSIADASQDCGMMGLRQLNDEGFRYQGQQMIVPPTTPPSVTLVKPEPTTSVKR